MEVTLRSLAIKHAQGLVTAQEVRDQLLHLSPVVKRQEAGETWFEGNPENTVAAVQALVGVEITPEQFHAFTALILGDSH